MLERLDRNSDQLKSQPRARYATMQPTRHKANITNNFRLIVRIISKGYKFGDTFIEATSFIQLWKRSLIVGNDRRRTGSEMPERGPRGLGIGRSTSPREDLQSGLRFHRRRR